MQETRVKGGSTRAECFRQSLIRQTGLSSPRQEHHLPFPPINGCITDQETAPGVHLAVSMTYQQITMPLQLIN